MVVVQDQVILDLQAPEACNSLAAGPNVQVANPGHLLLRAGETVVLTDGFSVAGGTLEIDVDPSLYRDPSVDADSDLHGQCADCDDGNFAIHPGAAEVCNGLDDDCNGLVDDGSFAADAQEPNDSCSSVSNLSPVGSTPSDNSVTVNSLTLYPGGDVEHFKIPAVETDDSCGNCDGVFLDEDYELTITLGVPAAAGSYQLCVALTACDPPTCQEALPGSPASWVVQLDGTCAQQDSYDVYVKVLGEDSPGHSCVPYTLQYQLERTCL